MKGIWYFLLDGFALYCLAAGAAATGVLSLVFIGELLLPTHMVCLHEQNLPLLWGELLLSVVACLGLFAWGVLVFYEIARKLKHKGGF